MPGGKFGSSEAEKRSFLASMGAKSAFSMLLTRHGEDPMSLWRRRKSAPKRERLTLAAMR